MWTDQYESLDYRFYDAVFDKGDEITAKVYAADLMSPTIHDAAKETATLELGGAVDMMAQATAAIVMAFLSVSMF